MILRIFLFLFYTFEKISNYHSHEKTIIIIRIIIMLFLRKTEREYLSLSLHLFKKQLNKQTSAYNSDHYKFEPKKQKVEHSPIRLFNIHKYEISKK